MKSVQVYSSPWCAGCKTIKKVLTEKNINFKEIDITAPEGGIKAKELGIKNIPVTYVHNLVGNISSEQKFIGSKPETIKQILEAIGD